VQKHGCFAHQRTVDLTEAVHPALNKRVAATSSDRVAVAAAAVCRPVAAGRSRELSGRGHVSAASTATSSFEWNLFTSPAPYLAFSTRSGPSSLRSASP
jgi:hypothetical protein